MASPNKNKRDSLVKQWIHPLLMYFITLFLVLNAVQMLRDDKSSNDSTAMLLLGAGLTPYGITVVTHQKREDQSD